jgi:hypothetical protein
VCATSAAKRPGPLHQPPSRERQDERGWTDIGDNQVANEGDAENEEGAGEKHIQHEDGIRTGIAENRSTLSACGRVTALPSRVAPSLPSRFNVSLITRAESIVREACGLPGQSENHGQGRTQAKSDP